MSAPTTVDEVRSAYLDFFKDRGHTVVPSSSLIPVGDPTLLLTSAGMVQFKPYFTGEEIPPSPRLASVQKCFRTSDIDEVGDTKHLTFFEMLGNFSIGEYFKKEAISWGWEFVTEVLGLPQERLWVTIYLDDDEAEEYWIANGVRKERILRYGEKENFWGPAGEEGPCGPSSEIHYDYGKEYGKDATPADGGERFVELWNLVFTQYYHYRDGTRTALPRPNIDTGMGLERTAAVMQHVTSVYSTDAFRYLIDEVAERAGKIYGGDVETDYAIRVAAEHARGSVFLVADGVVPSNEGRGYVLRRIVRRGIRYARKAGIQEPYMRGLAQKVIGQMSAHYPELDRQSDFVLSVIDSEEERFDRTLDNGMAIVQGMIAMLKSEGNTVLTGPDAFKLYDTFGFPLDITQDIAREEGLDVDLPGFEREMSTQRDRGRAAAKFGLGDAASPDAYRQLALPSARFTGYDTLLEETVVIGLVQAGVPIDHALKGAQVEVVLRETPFYAEGGGQVGDIGEIVGSAGRVVVSDTQMPIPGIVAHIGEVVEGEFKVGEAVRVAVDHIHRADVIRNHTATHLLHAALRKVLGPHVRQAGSLVAPDRLRFDFANPSSLGAKDLRDIEALVNEKVMQNLPVVHEVMSYADAMNAGALAFFGDKYGDVVRTCRVANGEDFSFELCGGTHARATGEIGLFHVLSEGSIGAGTRRIEAVTGRGTEAVLHEQNVLMESLAHQLQSSPSELVGRVGSLLGELDKERKRAAGMEYEITKRAAEALSAQVQLVGGVSVLAAEVLVSSADALRDMGDLLKGRLESSIIVLGTVINDRPIFMAMVTADLVSKGYHAGNLVREVAKISGGGGGGRAELAQAGGKDAASLKAALAAVPGLLKE